MEANDYYPFGQVMPGRTYALTGAKKTRFGFNGKEKDAEVNGDGVTLDYGFRIYDARLGRFLSMDRLAYKFPFYSPYHFAGNKPICSLDLDGLEDIYYFNADREKYKMFDDAWKILEQSGLMGEIQTEFGVGNIGVDMHVVVGYTGDINHKGQTENIIKPELVDEEKTPGGLNLFLHDNMRDHGVTFEQSQSMILNSSKKGRQFIEIIINEQTLHMVTMFGKQNDRINQELTKRVAFTIYHEMICHAMDLKDGNDDRSTKADHDYLYSKEIEDEVSPSGQGSPDYERVKGTNTLAGRTISRIEKAADKFFSK